MNAKAPVSTAPPAAAAAGRLGVLLTCFALAALALVARAVNLQIMEADAWQDEGAAQYLRTVELPVVRGQINDRNGEPLAVSTPVTSLAAKPAKLLDAPGQTAELAGLLKVDADDLERTLASRQMRDFLWLRRHLTPETATALRDSGLEGLIFRREYKRFYPAGEVIAQVTGLTNIDDIGQEGVELMFNDWLRGTPGSQRVIRDARGRVIRHVERLRDAAPGRDLTLTIDLRLQYLAYRELQSAVLQHGAEAASLVLLDARNGDILALANYPSYNPNQRGVKPGDPMRNRALTDPFEPGSVIKPFIAAAYLEAGIATPVTPVDTSPGRLPVGEFTVRDIRDYGRLDLTGVLVKSSNVGMAKLALTVPGEHLRNVLERFGFGAISGTGFPGESPGVLRRRPRWTPLEQATLSYGYGLSVTLLQLAQAYGAIAGGGRLYEPRLLHRETPPATRSVLDPALARQLTAMLEAVVNTPGGTGRAARVPLYRVAGKTGTSRKNSEGVYQSRYFASFSGFAPVSRPALVLVVQLDDPAGDDYYGGEIAAPVFARVMAGALRILDIPPDDYDQGYAAVEAQP